MDNRRKFSKKERPRLSRYVSPWKAVVALTSYTGVRSRICFANDINVGSKLASIKNARTNWRAFARLPRMKRITKVGFPFLLCKSFAKILLIFGCKYSEKYSNRITIIRKCYFDNLLSRSSHLSIIG